MYVCVCINCVVYLDILSRVQMCPDRDTRRFTNAAVAYYYYIS